MLKDNNKNRKARKYQKVYEKREILIALNRINSNLELKFICI